MAKRINYKKGDIVGNCTFVEDAPNIDYTMQSGRIVTMRRAKFQCYCGTEFVANITFVNSKKTKSCGCRTKKWIEGRKPYIKHGHSTHNNISSEYKTWLNIKRRCKQTNIISKEFYFDRGIKVCDRWNDNTEGFKNFFEDMGKRPSDSHSIDRIDNDRDYCPENCRWATITEQNGNKSSNVIIEYKGETKCLTFWAREFNLNTSTLKYRIKKGWGMERALTTPVDN